MKRELYELEVDRLWIHFFLIKNSTKDKETLRLVVDKLLRIVTCSKIKRIVPVDGIFGRRTLYTRRAIYFRLVKLNDNI